MIKADEFVRAWQTSDSIQQAADKVGRNKMWMSSTASRFRRKGIPLKKMPNIGNSRGNGHALDIAGLAKLATSLAPKVKK